MLDTEREPGLPKPDAKPEPPAPAPAVAAATSSAIGEYHMLRSSLHCSAPQGVEQSRISASDAMCERARVVPLPSAALSSDERERPHTPRRACSELTLFGDGLGVGTITDINLSVFCVYTTQPQQHGPRGAVRQPSVVRKPHVASILALVPSSSPRSLVRPRGAHHVAPGVGAGDVTYVSVVALSNALALVDFLLTGACSTTSAAVAGAWRSRFHAPTAASAQRA